ncbi:MAG: ferritin [Clostridiales Family XIII bacterium]|jgi:ferritin|nr:ferritin [Clostridiales Family XIII bacterium]
MISKKLLKALGDQLNAEFYSAYLYLAMSAEMDNAGFKGFANWLYVQAQEERAHAAHMFQYIVDRGAVPSFGPIEGIKGDFSTPVKVFDRVLKHEQNVTKSLNSIATIAQAENDHATYQFVMWYVNEQVEEEDNADEYLTRLKLSEGNISAIYNLDTILAARVFVDPFAGAAQA